MSFCKKHGDCYGNLICLECRIEELEAEVERLNDKLKDATERGNYWLAAAQRLKDCLERRGRS